eukprot:m.233921 g.233921  ORF g.233921 m.233921 type:complete len:800 (-) comp16030_c0_seq18:68-2467(-)
MNSLFRAFVCTVVSFSVTKATTKHDICIIGAGPGGLQLGHLLLQQGRDYVILERNSQPGSFFQKYPRHRRLISLNKRFTGRSSKEFNLRHDWNSLLDNDDVPGIPTRTEERWPPAQVLLEYLKEYASKQDEAGCILYNTTVDSITSTNSKYSSDGKTALKHRHNSFHLALSTAEGESQIECGAVVVATGLHIPHVPKYIPGISLAEGYENIPETGRPFERKSIAVFGAGNSGFEVADALAPFVNYVHVFLGHDSYHKASSLSWESRYVGNVRAVNAGLLDAYLLKSLDGAPGSGASVDKLTIHAIPENDNTTKYMLLLKGCKKNSVLLGVLNKKDKAMVDFVARLGQHRIKCASKATASGGPYIDISYDRHMDPTKPRKVDRYVLRKDEEPIIVSQDYITNETIHDIVEFVKKGGGVYPLIYDQVIRCLGWRSNRSIFSNEIEPKFQINQKYPALSPLYESVNSPGIFFAGQLAHGKDFKRSAGGFIHGFRYTARALSRILARTYYDASWPNRQFEQLSQKQGLTKLVKYMLQRIDEGSGPYQMIGVLGDGIVFNCGEDEPSAKYLEEIPQDYFHNQFGDKPRLFWSFGYEGQRRTYHDTMSGGTRFQVFVWFFPGFCGEKSSKSSENIALDKQLFRLHESLHTVWNNDFNQEYLENYLQSKVNLLAEKKKPWQDWTLKTKLQDSTVYRVERPGRDDPQYQEPLWLPTELSINIANSCGIDVDFLVFDKGMRQPPATNAFMRDGQVTTLSAYEGDLLIVALPGSEEIIFQHELCISRGIVQDIFLCSSSEEEIRERDEF